MRRLEGEHWDGGLQEGRQALGGISLGRGGFKSVTLSSQITYDVHVQRVLRIGHNKGAAMAKEISKERILALLKILFEQTDDKQALTMEQILSALEDSGISAERKAVYRDFEALNKAGIEVSRQRCKPVRYYLGKRPFTRSELLLLIDAVQGSKFITTRQSASLVKAIKSLGSKSQARGLEKRVFVGGRIKSQNDSVFRNVDAIQEAIAAKRKVTFTYASYDCSANVRLRNDGKTYTQTPVQLMYSDGFYYLVCFSDKYGDFANYRVDRMRNIAVSDERASRNAAIATFDVNEYDRRVFGMYSGESSQVVLRVEESAMNSIVDRFGRDVQVDDMDDGTARVSVAVMGTPVFFGWLSQFGGRVVIEQPVALRQEYATYLRGLLQDYE